MQKDGLIDHYLNHHKLNCPSCKLNFSNQDELKNHLSNSKKCIDDLKNLKWYEKISKTYDINCA